MQRQLFSPLALQKGDAAQVQRLLEEDSIDPNARYNYWCRPNFLTFTALHLACEKGEPEIVKLLLKNGADVFALSDIGANAIWYAQVRGHQKIVSTLLHSMHAEQLTQTRKVIEP